MGIFFFDPDYLRNCTSDLAESLQESAGPDRPSKFAVRTP
jgi:hypothetical protein